MSRVATSSFAWQMDIKMKGRERSTIEELCLYEVKDGKIIKEQFIYAMPDM